MVGRGAITQGERYGSSDGQMPAEPKISWWGWPDAHWGVQNSIMQNLQPMAVQGKTRDVAWMGSVNSATLRRALNEKG